MATNSVNGSNADGWPEKCEQEAERLQTEATPIKATEFRGRPATEVTTCDVQSNADIVLTIPQDLSFDEVYDVLCKMKDMIMNDPRFWDEA